MRNYTWAVIAILAVLICVAQQVWIVRHREAQASSFSATLPAPPRETYDVKALSRSLHMPQGAKSIGDSNSHQLQGTSYGTTGFDACLWIDSSGITFQGRAEKLREERVALIAAYYARQITMLIPGAVIEAAIERPGRAEAGSLHTTCLVRHESGFFVVSAGYTFTGRSDTDLRLLDHVKVNVISANNHANVTRQIGIANALTPGGS